MINGFCKREISGEAEHLFKEYKYNGPGFLANKSTSQNGNNEISQDNE